MGELKKAGTLSVATCPFASDMSPFIDLSSNPFESRGPLGASATFYHVYADNNSDFVVNVKTYLRFLI